MDKKYKFEIKRKIIHFFALIYVIIYLFFSKLFGHREGLLALLIVLIIFLIFEFYRIEKKNRIPFFHVFWRKKEKNRIGGHVYFLIGAIIAFSVFEKEIAIVSLLMATFGDAASALIGIKFGKHYIKGIKKRAWEGVAAEFVVDIVLGILLLNNFIITICMALTATFVETFFEHIDDNLSIPVFSGVIGQVLFILVH